MTLINEQLLIKQQNQSDSKNKDLKRGFDVGTNYVLGLLDKIATDKSLKKKYANYLKLIIEEINSEKSKINNDFFEI